VGPLNLFYNYLLIINQSLGPWWYNKTENKPQRTPVNKLESTARFVSEKKESKLKARHKVMVQLKSRHPFLLQLLLLAVSSSMFPWRPGRFRRHGLGRRPAGLGGAYTALSDDADGPPPTPPAPLAPLDRRCLFLRSLFSGLKLYAVKTPPP